MKSPKIKILHCITSLLPDGAQQMLLKLTQELNTDEFEFDIVSLRSNGGLENKFRQAGVEPYSIDCPRGIPSPRSLWKLGERIKSFEPDVLQGWMYHGNLAVLAAARLTRSSLPVVWNIRRGLDEGNYDKLLTRGVIKLGALLSGKVEKILYCGERVYQQHSQYGYRGTLHSVIPNGFRLAAFQPDAEAPEKLRALLHLGQESQLIGTVGRYHPQKDHRNLLDAMQTVAREFPVAALVMIGRDVTYENQELAKIIDELGLRKRVHLLGQRSDVAQLVAGLDIFCLPSGSEGFPNVVGEAMACAVPCVVTEAGASQEVVANTGIVVPTRNSAALAAGLGEMLRLSPGDRRALGALAHERVVREFAIERVVRMYEHEYKTLASRSSASNKSRRKAA